MDVVATTSAPAADTPETTTPAAPAEKVQGADISVTPQGAEPAGSDSEQRQQVTKPEDPEQKSADERRRQRNKERWDRMRQEANDARRRENFYLSEIERLKQQPDLSKITDPDEALAARTAQHLRQGQVQDHEAHAQAARSASQVAVREAWTAMADDMRAKAPDFDQVFNERTPVHQRAVPFIVESEKGGEIAYWLGKNPDAARDLANKFETNPAQALIELGRIEARVSAPVAKQVSTAPKPATPLNGGVNPLAFDAQKASVEDTAAMLRKAGLIR